MTQSPHNEYTVTIRFYDGFTSTRDLRNHDELTRYVSQGVAMHLLQAMTIVHNRPES